jgi:hypothetical protein
MNPGERRRREPTLRSSARGRFLSARLSEAAPEGASVVFASRKPPSDSRSESPGPCASPPSAFFTSFVGAPKKEGPRGSAGRTRGAAALRQQELPAQRSPCASRSSPRAAEPLRQQEQPPRSRAPAPAEQPRAASPRASARAPPPAAAPSRVRPAPASPAVPPSPLAARLRREPPPARHGRRTHRARPSS